MHKTANVAAAAMGITFSKSCGVFPITNSVNQYADPSAPYNIASPNHRLAKLHIPIACAMPTEIIVIVSGVTIAADSGIWRPKIKAMNTFFNASNTAAPTASPAAYKTSSTRWSIAASAFRFPDRDVKITVSIGVTVKINAEASRVAAP
jgi:hypothetical protein